MTAVVSGDVDMVTVFVEGAHVTIHSYRHNIEYVLKGSSDNGSFKIYSDYKMKITLMALHCIILRVPLSIISAVSHSISYLRPAAKILSATVIIT